MTTGKQVEKRNHILGFKEEIERASQSKYRNDFFSWFNTAESIDSGFIRGQWDFSIHFIDKIAPYIEKPEEKIALEVGYGGGRLLAAASKYFNKVVGLDIHENNDLVEEELKKRGVTDFILLTGDGKSIPVNSETVDFVYSFIVFQHLEKIEVVEKYLEEISRVLKKNGLALIYFGRYKRFSNKNATKNNYHLDKSLENFALRKGYKEFESRVNEVNILIAQKKFSAMAEKFSMTTVDSFFSHKKVPDGLDIIGGQHGCLLKRS